MVLRYLFAEGAWRGAEFVRKRRGLLIVGPIAANLLFLSWTARVDNVIMMLPVYVPACLSVFLDARIRPFKRKYNV